MKNPYIQQNQEKIQHNLSNSQNSGILGSLLPNSFNSASFFQGAVIGAVGAYLLTNEKAQQTLFKSILKINQLIQAGSEEIKERFEDAKAELEENEF
ncbi:hypothetical protein F1B92_01165 [Campylobacter sp. FMV-PI01]|uniref:YtxH domain-containing protein n=1 Tax=Campylobacter portucalensis TaxID=2608384 RepID=A0A6L5WIG3_9BACT|nr:YtxH domain-containing protein [Campylobacter portucalensis]MSN95815.1 hypothetical protein [Campylobacter portucalensis]